MIYTDNQNPYYDADMQNKLLKKAALREVKLSVLYCLAMIMISYLGAAIVIYGWMFLSLFLPALGNPVPTKLFEIAAYLVQLLSPALFYVLMFRKGLKDIYFVNTDDSDFCDIERITPKTIPTYFVMAFSLSQIAAIAGGIFSEIISKFGAMFSDNLVLDEQAFDIPAPESVAEFVLNFIAVAILPAILEELLFRGVFLNMFLKYGKSFAICISAFFFASVHGSTEQMVFSFVYGIIFGYIAVKTGSLTVGILIHFINNAYSCIVDYLGNMYDTDLFWSIIALLNIILVASGLGVTIYKIIKNKFGYCEKSDDWKQPHELCAHETFSVFTSPVMLLYYGFIAAETLLTYISYNITT